MTKVSVIIPVYNVEKYIERCARSLFEQTLDDLEYIFIDDCSPDGSIDILEKTLNDYPSRIGQVRIMKMSENSGQAKVRKAGVQAAVGEYVIFCDSDDWVDTTMYEKMFDRAEKEHLDMVVCGNVTTDGAKVISTNLNDFRGFKSLRHAIISDHVKNYSCTKLIRRKMFEFVSEWPEYNLLEDVAIITPIAYHCKSIGNIDEPLYFYYMNDSGTCRKVRGRDRAEQVKANVNLAINHIRNDGGGKEFFWEFIHRKCLAKLFCRDIPWSDYVRLFPEVNILLCFNPYIPIDRKLGHISKCLGTSGISKLWK